MSETRTADTRDHSLVERYGEGVVLESAESTSFDEKLAREFLGMKTYDRERKVRRRHVNYLVAAMERGTFRPEQVQLMSCEFDGDTYGVNGQQCGRARVNAASCPGGPVAVLRYRAKTVEGLRKLYASVDRGAPRIRSHVVASYLGDEFDLTTPQQQLLASSVLQLVGGRATDCEMDGDELATTMLGPLNDICHATARLIPELITPESRHMKRAAVIGAVLATMQVDQGDAELFWRSVSTGLGFDRMSDPRVRLRNWLLETSILGNAQTKRHASREDMYRVCLPLWNAWRQNESIQIVRIPRDRPDPI